MATLQIESAQIPAKINSRLLQQEIASALSIQPNEVELKIALEELRIVRSSPLGTEEEIVPPFIAITVPDNVDLVMVEQIVSGHDPAKNDSEEVIERQAEELKEQMRTLATDPEMVALIKLAVAS